MKYRRRPSSSPAISSLFAQLVPLEARRLLHSFQLETGGTLLATLDAASTLTFTIDGSNIRANLLENGVQHDNQAWPLKSVTKIGVIGSAFNDSITVDTAIKITALLTGNGGNDTIIGGGGNDSLGGGDGDDFLDGRGGADAMIGGNGYDVVDYSSRTKPIFVLRQAADPSENPATADVNGEKGERDLITGDVEEIRGGSGNDVMHGGFNGAEPAGNKLVGNGGNDSLYGGVGNNNDTLVGGSGNDYIDGGKGNDSIQGNSGADKLIGGDGNDTIDGGSGKDSIYGGAGRDSLYGSADRDVFYIHDGSTDTVDGGSGNDQIKDKKDSGDILTSVS